jgi:chondroitin 4-sulfotransferase 11
MPFFVKYNCLFLHIPKTGGTKICNDIIKAYKEEEEEEEEEFIKIYHPKDSFEFSHATVDMIKSLMPKEYDEAFKFTIVRNPYDKILSEFFYRKEYGYHKGFNKSKDKFNQFIHYLYKNFDTIMQMPHIEKSHFIEQHKFVDENVVIFKFEKFNQIINFLNNKFNFKISNEKINHTDHEHFSIYYDPDSRNKIYELYKKDFLKFNYNFSCDPLKFQ